MPAGVGTTATTGGGAAAASANGRTALGCAGVKTVQTSTMSPTFALANLFARPLHACPAGQSTSAVQTLAQSVTLSLTIAVSGAVHVSTFKPASAWAVKESWLIQPMTRLLSFGLSKTTRKNVERCAISVTVPPLLSVATTLPMPGISRTLVTRWIVAATFSIFFSSGKRETSFSFVAAAAAAATAATGAAASATSATAASASASAPSPFFGQPLNSGTSAARTREQETSLISRGKVVMKAGG